MSDWEDAPLGGSSGWEDAPIEEAGALKQFGKNVVGVGEGIGNFASGMLSAPALGLRSTGEYIGQNLFGSGTTMPNALETAESSADAITYHPKTQEGKDAAAGLSEGYSLLRDYAGKGFEWMAEHFPTMGQPGIAALKILMNQPGVSRTVGEAGFDLGGIPLAAKGIGMARGKLRDVQAPPVGPESISKTGVEPVMAADVDITSGAGLRPNARTVGERFDPTFGPEANEAWRNPTMAGDPRMGYPGEIRDPKNQLEPQLNSAEPNIEGFPPGPEFLPDKGTVQWEDVPIEQPRNYFDESAQKAHDTIPVESGYNGKPADFPSAHPLEEAGRPREEPPLTSVDPEAYRSPRMQDETIDFKKGLAGKGKKRQKSFREKGPITDIEPTLDQPAIEYWGSVLEDLNLPTDKVGKDRTLTKLIEQQETQRAQFNRNDELLRTEAAEKQRLYGGDITRSKESKTRSEYQRKNMENTYNRWAEITEKIKDRLSKIYGREGAFNKPVAGEKPLTAEGRGTAQIEKVGDFREGKNRVGNEGETPTQPTPSQQQQGRIFDKFKIGWEAAMDTPPRTMGGPISEGAWDKIKRGYEAATEKPEPEVYRSGRKINKGMGGKQSGAVDFSIFDKLSSDEVETRLSRMWAQYHNLKDSGETLAGLGPNKNSKALKNMKKALIDLEKISYKKFEEELPSKVKAHVEKDMQESVDKALAEWQRAQDEYEKGWEDHTKAEAKRLRFEEDIEKQGGTAKIYPFNRGPGGKQSGSFDPSEIGKGLAGIFNKKPSQPTPSQQQQGKAPNKGTEDLKRYLTADTRNVEDFLKDELGQAKDWKDIKKGWTDAIPGSNIATIAKDHPAIKWFVDRVTTIDREARNNKENAKYGSEFAVKRGMTSNKFNRRLRSDDGAMTLFERLPIFSAEKAFRVWLDKYDGVERDMTMQTLVKDGLVMDEAKAVLAAREQFKKFVEKYNASAEKNGYSPLPIRPNYFPHFWKGDYRVIAKDVDNQKVWIEGADNKYQAQQIRKELQAKFPDHKIYIGEAGSKFDLDNTDAFRDAIGILDKDDPARKVLQSAFEEILRKRGFRKQTIFRQGKPGYLGTKTGKEGVKDSLMAMEMYMDRGYNFLANQEKKSNFANLVQGLKKGGYDLQKETENAHDYMSSYLDNSTGGVKNGFSAIDDAVEGFGSWVGVGKSAGSNVLSSINGLASAWWLTTPRFAVAQLVQPLYNLPKAIQLKVAGVTEKSIIGTFADTYKETFFSPSDLTVKGMNWAKENGFIDSKILDLMGAKFDNRAKLAATAAQKFSRWSLGKLEQEAVRTPSFIFYDKLLRDAVPDNVERWTMAGQLTDKTMVDYTRSDAPLMYGKLGMVGEAIRPLKQFNHAYYGQMLEYINDIKNEKSVKPFAAMLGVQATVSGLKGLIGIAEATLVITALNSLFNWNIKTPEQLLAEKMGTTATFGPLSTATGIDMSGTLGAPQLNQMSGAPGIQFAAKAGMNVGEYSKDSMMGMDTDSSKMKAIQSVTPNAGQWAVEQAFTKPGMGPPDPNHGDPMPQASSPRDSSDLFARIMGGHSPRESQEMMRLRAVRSEDKQMTEQRGKYLNVLVDRLVNDKDIDTDKWAKEWMERGGNPESLANDLQQKIQSSMKDAAIRYLGNMSPNLSTAERAERLQRFNLLSSQITDPDEQILLLRELQNAK